SHSHTNRGSSCFALRAMRGEEFPSERTHRDEASAALQPVALDEASFIRIFPHRKTGTGGAPRVHDLGIRPAPGADPFEKIEDQKVDRVGHSYCASIQLSDPASLTATFEKDTRTGEPSAVPRWSVEKRRGPAFL